MLTLPKTSSGGAMISGGLILALMEGDGGEETQHQQQQTSAEWMPLQVVHELMPDTLLLPRTKSTQRREALECRRHEFLLRVAHFDDSKATTNGALIGGRTHSPTDVSTPQRSSVSQLSPVPQTSHCESQGATPLRSSGSRVVTIPFVHHDVGVFVGGSSLVVVDGSGSRIEGIPYNVLYSVALRTTVLRSGSLMKRADAIQRMRHMHSLTSEGPDELSYAEMDLIGCKRCGGSDNGAAVNAITIVMTLCATGAEGIESLRAIRAKLSGAWSKYLHDGGIHRAAYAIPRQVPFTTHGGALLSHESCQQHSVAMSTAPLLSISRESIQQSPSAPSLPAVSPEVSIQNRCMLSPSSRWASDDIAAVSLIEAAEAARQAMLREKIAKPQASVSTRVYDASHASHNIPPVDALDDLDEISPSLSEFLHRATNNLISLSTFTTPAPAYSTASRQRSVATRRIMADDVRCPQDFDALIVQNTSSSRETASPFDSSTRGKHVESQRKEILSFLRNVKDARDDEGQWNVKDEGQNSELPAAPQVAAVPQRQDGDVAAPPAPRQPTTVPLASSSTKKPEMHEGPTAAELTTSRDEAPRRRILDLIAATARNAELRGAEMGLAVKCVRCGETIHVKNRNNHLATCRH